MMTNLFSIFDPSTSQYFSLNWLSIMISIILIPQMFWFIPSRYQSFLNKIILNLMHEFKMITKNKKNYMNMFMLIPLFMMIMLNNLYSLFPYIFTSTSHMMMTLSYSMPMWISMMMFGWIKNMNHMFMHLTPQGTPPMLMFFMVIIETISNIIRPLTLSVRLSANMIAGHLLMSLLSSTSSHLYSLPMIIMIFTQTILISLELAVSLIQAYVITILILLYTMETN